LKVSICLRKSGFQNRRIERIWIIAKPYHQSPPAAPAHVDSSLLKTLAGI
jgi:hypothetical protein